MKWLPGDCAPGDMVRVRAGSVDHYGVFVSKDEIIQFGLPPQNLFAIDEKEVRVCATDARAFSCGKIMERAVLDRGERRRRIPPEKTVALARSRLGESGYSLLHNNCEHFAYSCVFGVNRSSQMEEFQQRWANRPILDVYIAPLPETVEILPVACRARQAEIEQTRNPALRAARYYDWRVLLYAADRSLGIRGEDPVFRKKSSGKWVCDRFQFSLSHTAGAVAVAVSNGAVGVDVENVEAFENRPLYSEDYRRRLFRRMGTERELAANSDGDALGLWLKKESIFKCFGNRKNPLSVETGDHAVKLWRFDGGPVLRLAVCGDHLQAVRFLLYRDGSADAIHSEIVKSES